MDDSDDFENNDELELRELKKQRENWDDKDFV